VDLAANAEMTVVVVVEELVAVVIAKANKHYCKTL